MIKLKPNTTYITRFLNTYTTPSKFEGDTWNPSYFKQYDIETGKIRNPECPISDDIIAEYTGQTEREIQSIDPATKPLENFTVGTRPNCIHPGGRLVRWLEGKSAIHPTVLAEFHPNVDNNKGAEAGFIYAWLDQKGKDSGRNGRVKMKPGKLFRRMNPLLTDQQIESLVDQFKTDFAPREFKVFHSEEGKDFVKAYSGTRAESRNLITTNYRKSLSSSCMRHSFDGQENHPALAYASGDFWIVWAELQGKIAGRCVVWKNVTGEHVQPGPTYGVCEESIDAINEYIESEFNCCDVADSYWAGAEYQRIEEEGRFVGPYVDVSPDALEDAGDYLIQSSSGSISCTCYEEGLGFFGHAQPNCESCGDPVHEMEVCHSPDGGAFCDYCWERQFFTSEYDSEVYPMDELESVYSNCGSEYWTETQANDCAVYIEHRGEYWMEESVTMDGRGNPIVDSDVSNGDWAYCDFTSEYWPSAEVTETQEGDSVQKEYAESNGWVADENDVYFVPDSESVSEKPRRLTALNLKEGDVIKCVDIGHRVSHWSFSRDVDYKVKADYGSGLHFNCIPQKFWGQVSGLWVKV